MVVIESIMAIGFRKLRFEQPVSLEKGLTIIRGPNEAGKSTLIEAILFGLYGDINLSNNLRKPVAGTGRITLNDLIAHGARRAVIEVVFRVGDRRYKVYRVIERRGQSASQVEARLIDLTANRIIATGIRPVAQEVEKIIGVSWKEMLATNVVAQKDLEQIVQLRTRDREAIINMMMGLDSFNKAKNRANEEKNKLTRQLESMEAELRSKCELLKELENTKKQYDKYLKEKGEIEKQLTEVKKKLEQVEKVASYLEELYNYLERKKQLEEAKKSLNSLLQKIQREIASKYKRREDLKGKLESTKNDQKRKEEKLKNVTLRYQEKTKVLNRLKSILSKLEKLKTEYNKLQTTLHSRQQDLRKLAEELGVNPEIPVDRWKTEIEKKVEIPRLTVRQIALPILLALSSIPLFLVIGLLAIVLLILGLGLFGYEYHKVQTKKLQYASTFAKLKDAEVWSKEIEKYKEEMQKLSNKIYDIIEQLPDNYRERLKGGINEIYESLKVMVENIDQETNELNQEIAQLNTLIGQLKKSIKEHEADLRSLEEEIKEGQKEFEEKQKELHEIERLLSSLSPPERSLIIPDLQDSENLEEVKKTFLKYQDALNSLRNQKTKLETRLGDIIDFIEKNKDRVERLDEVKQDIENLEKAISEIEPRITVLDVIINSLSDISRKLRESFAPSVEQYMGRILNTITDGRYKAVKIDPQTYDIQVFDAQAGKFLPRNIYSGGTNDQFLLAMRLAFTLALLRGAKGTYPRFLFLDEPLGSSDSERRRRILRLLSEELTKYFEQIILITHVEIPEIPNALLVTMEEGRIVASRRISEIPEAEI